MGLVLTQGTPPRKLGRLLARHLMELKEDRFLKHEENVDHIDEDKTNDHIDNLQILTRGQNAKKSQVHRRKTKNWDDEYCSNTCPICGKISETKTAEVRVHWHQNNPRYVTCSISCGGVLRVLRQDYPTFFSWNFQDLAGKFMMRKASKEDRERLRNREIFISEILKERKEGLLERFHDQIRKHEPDMKKSGEYSQRLLQFLQSRLNDFGREDWNYFHKGVMKAMNHLTDEERLEFLFRVVYPFDPTEGKKMTWTLFITL